MPDVAPHGDIATGALLLHAFDPAPKQDHIAFHPEGGRAGSTLPLLSVTRAITPWAHWDALVPHSYPQTPQGARARQVGY